MKIEKLKLMKIIEEETAKVFEAHDEDSPSVTRPGEEDYTGHKGNISKTHAGDDYMDSDDLADFDKDDPQEWQDWDVVVSALRDFIITKARETVSDEREVQRLEYYIEEPLLDMVKEWPRDAVEIFLEDDEEDDLLKMGRAKKGRRNFGNADDADLMEKKKKKKDDPDAKVRNRGDVTFPADSSKVKDNEDHFPVNTSGQCHSALSYASKYKSVPSWYDGTLEELVKAVKAKVKSKCPDIETTKASSNPGKG